MIQIGKNWKRFEGKEGEEHLSSHKGDSIELYLEHLTFFLPLYLYHKSASMEDQR